MPFSDHPVLVAAGHHLHTAVCHRRRIDRGPHRGRRIVIHAPAHTHVLMPRQYRALFRRLVHKHRPENRHVLADIAPSDLAKERMLHIGEIDGVLLQAHDLAVLKRGALVAGRDGRHLRVVGVLPVELKLHLRVGDLAEHDRVDALL